MQFSNTTTKDGLIQDCELILFDDYGTISGDATRLATFTRLINRAYDKAATIIMEHDNRWQWDDTNQTTQPIGSTDLVDGQQDYVFDVTHLRIVKALVKDSSGNSIIVNPIDIHDPEGRSMYQESPTAVEGVPIMYDKLANLIKLYPTPNYDYTSGLTVHFQRGPSYFVSTDTTKVAGIPSIFHRYLSVTASADYAIQKQLGNKNDLFSLSKELEEDIKKWYQKRSKDEQLTLRAKIRSSK